jgi:hypothetical protein
MAEHEQQPELSRLLAAAKRVIDLDEMKEQRVSFAYGNGNIDGDGFSRATMSVVIPPTADAGGTDTGAAVAPNSILHRHEVEGAVRQFDITIDLVLRFTQPGAPKFNLDLPVIQALHDALLTQGEIGGVRTSAVRIPASSFNPPAPDVLHSELERMCETINSGWDTWDALELAAFALWRLNWIHPFTDGNGRTARALSYLTGRKVTPRCLWFTEPTLDRSRTPADDSVLAASDRVVCEKTYVFVWCHVTKSISHRTMPR